MKKLISSLTFVFLFQLTNGQDTIRHFEFGSTLVTINSFSSTHYFALDRPSVEFVNALFFRYTKKRLGLRAHASYSDNTSSYSNYGCVADGSSGDIHNKDIRIGLGGQFSILKRKDWFYTFLDLTYRNVFSTGHSSGGITGASERFSSTANGIDCFLGLGFKIKTFKNVYLSPEVGYNCSTKFTSKTTTPLLYGQPSKFNYSETTINPVLKLHLTVKF